MRAFNLAQLRISDIFNANNRYLNLAETCYKTCNLLFDPNVLSFFKIGGTLLAKSKIQRMSPKVVQCRNLIFVEPFFLRRKFWGIPLRCTDIDFTDAKMQWLPLFLSR